ncbi:glucose-6-phosphate isomerase [Pseudomonas sp. OIL-1]|uniref:glucose-6-phosphate isomerase n=1 Tax=Pseudomonas sp. OIL-1 TaxID=2706126 RepID=UPI0013A7740B|nr:glucose-6-phosphate isomerase [Pseudomonas sp. OIL-1]QIB52594.1 glucose-6-phosphate isomerase [Pseudomonas sp. OIL-1]
MTEARDKQWDELITHGKSVEKQHLADFFAEDSERFNKMHRQFGPLMYDFSKQRMTTQTLRHLIDLADAHDLQGWIDKLFSGEQVNCSEGRAAMHWALRLPADAKCQVGEDNVTAQVHGQLQQMERIVDQIHAGQWRGATGEVITDVINIGVGGSDLGPLMVTEALNDFTCPTKHRLNVHFASTIDGSQLSQLLRDKKPQSTLFVISSKSFTTIDTLTNAATALQWLQRSFGKRASSSILHCHFIGVSASPNKMTEWGIAEENQLDFWGWVGGRYSLWSAIGLPIALKIGMYGFRQLLSGAHDMDEHFKSAPWQDNLPVLMGMIGVWNTNILDINALSILPYDGRLKQLPLYLEQLEMESNGKSVSREGEPVARSTCPIIWGDVGPNAQHAFYQLLHQGTEAVTCDFIVPVRRYHEAEHHEAAEELAAQHQLSLANCLAQSRLLALGDAALKNAEELPLHMRYRGNQSSSTVLLDELNPYSLGALIALYEHKVFVQSVIWGINPFDQWGVEMGKKIAMSTLAKIRGEDSSLDDTDVSTAGLLRRIKAEWKS